MARYEVVIVGAGPAGSCAALRLAKQGVKVALVDKATLPRYKTCGGGIVHRAVKYLPVDISPVVERKCLIVEYNLFASNLHFDVIRDQPIISMTMRDSFDNLLASEAQRAGAEIIHGCEVLNVHRNPNSIVLETKKEVLNTNFLIAADGALSIVAKKTGWQETRLLIPALECEVYVDDRTLENFSKTARFDFDLVPDGYAWVFPKKDHLSIGVLSMKRGNIKLTNFLKRYLEILRITAVIKIEQHGFIIPVNPRKDELMKDRVLLIGDAAGFADPITAEGISFAILSGHIAADALVKGSLKKDLVKEIFDHEIQEKILNELKIGKILGRLIYNYPKVRTTLFRLYGNKLTKAMTQVFMGEKSYTTIIKNPLNYLKLLRVWNQR